MNTLLSVSPRQALPLIERVSAGAAVGAEYPLVFGHKAPGGVIAVGEESAHPRSACAILARDFVTPQGIVKVGLIGSVATDPRGRNEGRCSAVLAAAEQELARRGALLAILWADDAAYYEKRGWKPFGWEIDFTIAPECAAQLPEPFGVRERKPEDDGQIHQLYERHPERVARTSAETSALLSCPNMEVLVVERWGRIAGYTCLGRGADLQNVVHEWAGDAQALLTLLREHLARRKERGVEEALFLICPPSAVDVAERLTKIGAQMSQGVVGMGKILRPLAAGELAATLLDRRGGVRCSGADEQGNVRFSGPKGEASCTREALLELLFAPRAERAMVESVGGQLGVPGVELPLTPFLWGLDSI